jgi:hypothetical protein
LSGFAGYLANAGLVLDQTAGSKGVTVSLNSATKVGTSAALVTGANGNAADTGGPFAATTAGITLGVNSSDTVVFSSSMAQDVVIGTFTGGVGATVATPIDKLNLSAMGVKMADLTFTNYDNGADNTTAESVADSVQISITGITGKIYIIGSLAATLTEANFVF